MKKMFLILIALTSFAAFAIDDNPACFEFNTQPICNDDYNNLPCRLNEADAGMGGMNMMMMNGEFFRTENLKAKHGLILDCMDVILVSDTSEAEMDETMKIHYDVSVMDSRGVENGEILHWSVDEINHFNGNTDESVFENSMTKY